MLKLFELLFRRKTVIIATEAPVGGGNPKDTVFIFYEIADYVSGNSGNTREMPVGLETLAIIAIQSIVGANPNKPAFVLQDAIDFIMR